MLQKLSYSTQATTFWSRQCYSHSYFIDKELVLREDSSSPKATQQQRKLGLEPWKSGFRARALLLRDCLPPICYRLGKQDCMGYWAWPRMMSEWPRSASSAFLALVLFHQWAGSAVLWVTESRRKQQRSWQLHQRQKPLLTKPLLHFNSHVHFDHMVQPWVWLESLAKVNQFQLSSGLTGWNFPELSLNCFLTLKSHGFLISHQGTAVC